MSEQKFKLFREKSMKSIESPEELTDYLKVTSPRVWLVLVAVMLILVGVLAWSIVGRIGTTTHVAVIVNSQGGTAYIPQNALDGAIEAGTVTVNGLNCNLDFENVTVQVISQHTDVQVLLNGSYNYGDMVFCVNVPDAPVQGNFSGTIVSGNIQPISLLFN